MRLVDNRRMIGARICAGLLSSQWDPIGVGSGSGRVAGTCSQAPSPPGVLPKALA